MQEEKSRTEGANRERKQRIGESIKKKKKKKKEQPKEKKKKQDTDGTGKATNYQQQHTRRGTQRPGTSGPAIQQQAAGNREQGSQSSQ